MDLAKICKPFIGVMCVIAIALLVLLLISYRWMTKLMENPDCACAVTKTMMNLRRYLIFLIGYTVVVTGLNLYAAFTSNCVRTTFFDSPVMTFVNFVLFIMSIVFIVYSFKYLAYLKNSHCECATSGKGDDVFKSYVIIQVVLYSFIGLLLILGVVATFVARRLFIRDVKMAAFEAQKRNMNSRK